MHSFEYGTELYSNGVRGQHPTLKKSKLILGLFRDLHGGLYTERALSESQLSGGWKRLYRSLRTTVQDIEYK